MRKSDAATLKKRRKKAPLLLHCSAATSNYSSKRGFLTAAFFILFIACFAFAPGADGNESHRQQQNSSPQGIPAPGFITTEKRAHISGIRIEPEEPGEPGFIGYADKGVSIVVPDTRVRVVIFGFWLDEVDMVGFTPNDNCSNTIEDIRPEDFWIQTERRMVIMMSFPESKALFKICMKQKKIEVSVETLDPPYSLVDDLKVTVTTDTPPRQYYFPMGIQIAIVAIFLVLSGLFSGLNLGLMSLTPQELTLISNSGSQKERRYAQTILPIRKSGNLLLCSLLIGNVMVNSAISILFDDLTSGYVALIVSSAGIVCFGEIFPQALCVKKGLAVGAHTIWVTRIFMALTFPLAYPISRLLDSVLGEEVVGYDRKRLMELIKMSTKTAGTAEGELKIAIGAMELADKTVSDVMTRIDDVFMLPEDTILNTKVVAEIVRSGYTRIPVYAGTNRNNVVALLFVKDLALLDPDDNFSVKTVCGYHHHALRQVNEDTPLRAMLEEFKKGDYHLAMVRRSIIGSDGSHQFEMIGIVTLEDIIEEILQAEIVDETDVITDNVSRIRRRRVQAHDFTPLISGDDQTQCVISMQMQLVTVQFLMTKHLAFAADKIAPSILEKVIRKHVHKVEVTHLATDIEGSSTNIIVPRTAKLYTKQEASDKFILILEGRAIITIGRNEMTFEAGPWQCFGMELLDKLRLMIEQKAAAEQTSFATPLQNMPSAAVASSTSVTGLVRGPRTDSVSGAAIIAPAVMSEGFKPLPQAAAASSSSAAELGAGEAKKITFVPDFSMVIRDECTYLEITAQTYLLAYKSTLIQKNKGNRDGESGGGGIHHVHGGTRVERGTHDSFRSLRNHGNGFIVGGSSTGSSAVTTGSGQHAFTNLAADSSNKPTSAVAGSMHSLASESGVKTGNGVENEESSSSSTLCLPPPPLISSACLGGGAFHNKSGKQMAGGIPSALSSGARHYLRDGAGGGVARSVDFADMSLVEQHSTDDVCGEVDAAMDMRMPLLPHQETGDYASSNKPSPNASSSSPANEP